MFQSIQLKYFYAIHQLAIIHTFADDGGLEVLGTKTNQEIYGYSSDPDKNIGSLAWKINQVTRYSISGKTLYDLKIAYNKAVAANQSAMKINKKYLQALLVLIGNEKTPETAFKRYCTDRNLALSSFKPEAIRVKGDKKKTHKEGSPELRKITYHYNLQNIALTRNWEYYFYEYEDSTREAPILIRLLFTIEFKNDSYQVQLINTGDPYMNLSGRVIHSSGLFFICELSSSGKQLTLYVSVDNEGNSQMLTAIYLKNDRDGKLFSGSVLLNRIEERKEEDDSLDTIPQVFKAGDPQIQTIHRAFRNFFKAKQYTFIKTPRRFDPENLDKWIGKKEKQRDEYIEIDMFISVTVLSLERRKRIYSGLKEDIVRLANKMGLLDESKEKKFAKEIVKILEKRILRKKLKDAISFDWEKISAATALLKQNLERHVEGINKVHNSREGIDPRTSHYLEPSVTFEADFKNLQRSKTFMLICPYPDISSSCWILLGFALMLRKPVFLVVQDPETDLPYLMKGGITILNNVHVFRINQFDDIPDLYNKLIHNGFDERYFRDY